MQVWDLIVVLFIGKAETPRWWQHNCLWLAFTFYIHLFFIYYFYVGSLVSTFVLPLKDFVMSDPERRYLDFTFLTNWSQPIYKTRQLDKQLKI